MTHKPPLPKKPKPRCGHCGQLGHMRKTCQEYIREHLERGA